MSVGAEIAVLAGVAGLLLAIASWILLQYRVTPEKREVQRRQIVHRHGRLVDGTVTEANASTIYYTYAVGGVGYTASQDITGLYEFLPADPERVIGPVTIKYSPQNAANSIVVCEYWSGLRVSSHEIHPT